MRSQQHTTSFLDCLSICSLFSFPIWCQLILCSSMNKKDKTTNSKVSTGKSEICTFHLWSLNDIFAFCLFFYNLPIQGSLGKSLLTGSLLVRQLCHFQSLVRYLLDMFYSVRIPSEHVAKCVCVWVCIVCVWLLTNSNSPFTEPQKLEEKHKSWSFWRDKQWNWVFSERLL